MLLEYLQLGVHPRTKGQGTLHETKVDFSFFEKQEETATKKASNKKKIVAPNPQEVEEALMDFVDEVGASILYLELVEKFIIEVLLSKQTWSTTKKSSRIMNSNKWIKGALFL
ncbi:hypothetical protein GOP47_0025308 [Adiantum capillus-veneris]|uniref:Uncharacterized protein n=1 Tax=Adiantum capillus-veneris TaxID=13818 RepID=A0A9D4Z2W4_ADICA|nr:hypothetical protein GOP47_0025308 [Adiantum capillus-veneris]